MERVLGGCLLLAACCLAAPVVKDGAFMIGSHPELLTQKHFASYVTKKDRETGLVQTKTKCYFSDENGTPYDCNTVNDGACTERCACAWYGDPEKGHAGCVARTDEATRDILVQHCWDNDNYNETTPMGPCDSSNTHIWDADLGYGISMATMDRFDSGYDHMDTYAQRIACFDKESQISVKIMRMDLPGGSSDSGMNDDHFGFSKGGYSSNWWSEVNSRTIWFTEGKKVVDFLGKNIINTDAYSKGAFEDHASMFVEFRANEYLGSDTGFTGWKIAARCGKCDDTGSCIDPWSNDTECSAGAQEGCAAITDDMQCTTDNFYKCKEGRWGYVVDTSGVVQPSSCTENANTFDTTLDSPCQCNSSSQHTTFSKETELWSICTDCNSQDGCIDDASACLDTHQFDKLQCQRAKNGYESDGSTADADVNNRGYVLSANRGVVYQLPCTSTDSASVTATTSPKFQENNLWSTDAFAFSYTACVHGTVNGYGQNCGCDCNDGYFTADGDEPNCNTPAACGLGATTGDCTTCDASGHFAGTPTWDASGLSWSDCGCATGFSLNDTSCLEASCGLGATTGDCATCDASGNFQGTPTWDGSAWSACECMTGFTLTGDTCVAD